MERLADPRVRDACLVAALVALGAVAVAVPDARMGLTAPGDGTSRPSPASLLVVVALALPLLWRRRRPGLVVALVGAVFAVRVAWHTGSTAADLAVPLAVDAVAAYGTRRSAWGLVPLLAGQVVVVLAMPSARADVTPAGTLIAVVLLVAAPLAVGLARRGAPEPAASAPRAAPATPHRPAELAALTPRELDVLDRLVLGESNAEIAAALGISAETVKTHVARLTAKLGVRDRTAAAVLATRRATP